MRDLRPAVAGILAAAAGVAAAELLASISRPQPGPVVAVGGAVIDAAPTPVKEFMVKYVGTYDKPLLLGGIAILLALYAALAGRLGHRRLRYGLVAVALFGLVGAVAAIARPAGRWYDIFPSLLGAAIAGALLTLLLRLLTTATVAPTASVGSDTPAAAVDPAAAIDPLAASSSTAGAPAAVASDTAVPPTVAAPAGGTGRRTFLQGAVATAAGTALFGGAAYVVRGGGRMAAEKQRASLVLPRPASPAPSTPAGMGPGFYTRNSAFYRVDTALTTPRLDPDQWRLRITGMVSKPREFSLAELLRRPLTERDITLNCVSNEVGGPYIGTARWLGVPLATILREVGIDPRADQLVARSTDGMTIGSPVSAVIDGRDALLAVGMNGEALPFEHGFPVRMVTPGLYGYVGACKWVTELTLTTFANFDAYWVQRDWAAQAPVKTASRIDRPAPFGQLAAGTATIAGVAWAQHRGISGVQVQVDDGPWQDAELLPTPSIDTWVQWRLSWQATRGSRRLRVRAIDKAGNMQVEKRATPFPDGATGWHTVAVTVN